MVDNKTKKKSKGDLDAIIHFNPDLIKVNILPSQFYLTDSVWNIAGGNNIVFDNCMARRRTPPTD